MLTALLLVVGLLGMHGAASHGLLGHGMTGTSGQGGLPGERGLARSSHPGSDVSLVGHPAALAGHSAALVGHPAALVAHPGLQQAAAAGHGTNLLHGGPTELCVAVLLSGLALALLSAAVSRAARRASPAAAAPPAWRPAPAPPGRPLDPVALLCVSRT